MRIGTVNREKGAALIQVLLISTILSIFAIQINVTTRNQVKLATQYIERADAIFELKTAKSEVFFALLTQPRRRDQFSDSQVAQKWNFYNSPFQLESGVEIKLQDLSGLFSANQMSLRDKNDIFEYLEIDPSQSSRFWESLADWQDEDDLSRLNGAEKDAYSEVSDRSPRNDKIQFFNELKFVKGMTPELWEAFRSMVTTYSQSEFNPYTAPLSVLEVKYGDGVANTVKGIRESSFEFNLTQFIQQTGIIATDGITFYPSPNQKVTLSINVGDMIITDFVTVSSSTIKKEALQVRARSEY